MLEKCLTDKNVNENQKQKVWSDLEAKKKKKRELEVIIEHRTKGTIVRSKFLWQNEGEKNTKYFLNLERSHCKKGRMTHLKVNDDDLVCTEKEILNECVSFYQNYFTSPK